MDHEQSTSPSGHDDGLAALVRPILEMAQAVTGLESAYLTSIDATAGRQTVILVRNAGAMRIPEGLQTPWSDALCRRALEAGQAVEPDVPARWPDVAAARELGIRTHVSCPVRSPGGRLYGTLCGASTHSVEVSADARRVLDMASRLIGLHLEREQLLSELERANAELAQSALTDAVTGLPNRRALAQELGRMLARAQRDGMAVFAACIDLGDFARIDDQHGQGARDSLLRAMAERLSAGLRGGDLVARLGGDGFVVVGTVPRETAEASGEVVRERLQAQVAARVDGQPVAHACASVDQVIARVGEFEPEALLARAEAAMHAARRVRRQSGG